LAETHELTNWLAARQANLKVTKTTTTPYGQILDWVPVASQTHDKIATPPPGSDPHHVAYGLDPKKPTKGVDLGIGEPGPEGHVPILRPDISKLKGVSDLDHSLTKRGGLLINVNRRHKEATESEEPTDPDPAGYFHSTSGQTSQVFGCEAWYNVWDPQVNIPSSPGDDHSISQTWLQNYQKPTTQSIEAGLTVDRSLNGDLTNHIFSYYTTNGYTADGDNIGGYNRIHKGWTQIHASIFPGIRINGSSVQGGVQLEIGLKYQLFNGNWWLGFNNNESGPWIWLGYYPASLFAGGIGGHAEFVSFGGEVFSALANPCSTKDQMGSGRHAAASFGHSTFQRNLRNQSNTGGAMVNFNGIAEVDSGAKNCPGNVYTIQCFMNSGSTWGSYQYFGGPAA
jgi:hypothetical protein